MNSSSDDSNKQQQSAYWSKSLNIVYLILGIWCFVSLGCGILLRDLLDEIVPPIGGAPFGFWMAQQGAIICFLLLLVLYMLLMNRLDRKFGFADQEIKAHNSDEESTTQITDRSKGENQQ